MNLSIYIGSPRGKKSNSHLLMESLIEGFFEYGKNDFTVHYLHEKSKWQEHIDDYFKSDISIVIVPLYCDAMPSIVMEFIEALPSASDRKPKLGFIIHSGFEESCQSVYLKDYFDTIERFVPCHYIGTIVKGGSEGIQVKPPFMTNKMFAAFRKQGASLARTASFDTKVTEEMARPFRYSKVQVFFIKLFVKRMADGYWTGMMKKNDAYEKRFDAPYAALK